MICPNCATENRESAKFCDECGFPLTGAIAHAAEQLGSLSSAQTAQLPAQALAEALSAEQPAENDTSASAIPDEAPVPDVETLVEEAPIDEAPASVAEEDILEVTSVGSDAQAKSPTLVDGIALEDGWPEEYAYDENAFADDELLRPPDLSGLDAMPTDEDFGERFIPESQLDTRPNWRDGATIQMPKIEGETPKRTAFKASTNAPRSNTKKIVAGILAGVVVIAGIIAFATYQMEMWGGHSVPNVVNMTQAEAENMLTEQGFKVRSEQVKSDDTEGLVLIVDPGVGSRVNSDDEVVIHVASARVVPTIVGLTEEQAVSQVKLEDLTNVTYVKQRSDAAPGTILSVSPEPGTRVKSATAVTVVVAEPYKVPDISGMYLDDAMSTISNAGLSPWVYYVYTTDYPDNSIIGTDPSKDTIVKGGSSVAILIARARGAELEEAARHVVYEGAILSLSIYNYQVNSVSSLSYQGNDTVAYTATATPYVVVFGQTVWGAPETITGTIVFDDDNNVVSIS